MSQCPARCTHSLDIQAVNEWVENTVYLEEWIVNRLEGRNPILDRHFDIEKIVDHMNLFGAQTRKVRPLLHREGLSYAALDDVHSLFKAWEQCEADLEPQSLGISWEQAQNRISAAKTDVDSLYRNLKAKPVPARVPESELPHAGAKAMMNFEWLREQELWELFAAVRVVCQPKGYADFGQYRLYLDACQRPGFQGYGISTFATMNSEQYRMAMNAIRASSLWAHYDERTDMYLVKPCEFLTWAQTKGMEVPEELAPLLKQGTLPAAPVTPPAEATKRTLAAELGVKAWHELEAECTIDGLRWKRIRASGRGRMRNWVELGLAKSKERQRLLIHLAQTTADGIANPRTGKHRSLVRQINVALCTSVGLSENPIKNVAGLRTQCAFQITWADKELKPKSGTVPLNNDDKWAMNYDGDE